MVIDQTVNTESAVEQNVYVSNSLSKLQVTGNVVAAQLMPCIVYSPTRAVATLAVNKLNSTTDDATGSIFEFHLRIPPSCSSCPLW